ncbi:tripartite tricarboxylate transporter substrate binding protein [Pigmentiphaga sp. H8]|uniref:Bug family tripartite tricarboxylate transporter substrate binding protein n=1 Tax=unclassified Pigmentiphaga TaxID=2626614 RepID=UPI000F591FCF|nr:tripartite tricarboxylate transporter substrate binding protein [Pigmentiphaga sp. H8]AZG10948.1 tripartite tricarboxylate transporter substrate binding protein [Pigmentiphaga sp. H8]
MSMHRIAAAVLALSCAAGAHAASFPSKMIHLVVPFPPGGVADLVTRTVGQKVAQDIGQPVVVDNKPGASGIIGAEHVARAAPDGYTLLVANLPVLSINELQYSDLPYSASRDFTPVVMLADQPYIIAAKPGLPVADLAAFTRLAKQKPGALTFGSASSSTYLAGELFNARAGTRMTHVPYKGSAPAINDLLGGHIDLLLDPVITLLPHARAGKIQALAVTSPTRIDIAPEIPTYKEAGLEGLDITSWQGIVAPAATPREVVETLNAAFNRALKSPEVAARLKEQGVSVKGGSAAQFAAFVEGENQRWAKLAREVGFQPTKR